MKAGKLGDFWSKVDIKGDDDCWNWTGMTYRNRDLRGLVRVKKKLTFAHREAWRLTHGEIPKGMCVCHKCDVTTCCNPRHLFIGTQLENIADRQKKGRCKSKGPDGQKNGMAKLRDDQANEILRLLETKAVKSKEIAKRFGVSESLISRMKHGKAWVHLGKKAKGDK